MGGRSWFHHSLISSALMLFTYSFFLQIWTHNLFVTYLRDHLHVPARTSLWSQHRVHLLLPAAPRHQGTSKSARVNASMLTVGMLTFTTIAQHEDRKCYCFPIHLKMCPWKMVFRAVWSSHVVKKVTKLWAAVALKNTFLGTITSKLV